MNYANIKVPYLGEAQIASKAESFLRKFWNNNFPVDIEKIIEQHLNINIVPVPEMKKYCDIDALITSNWTSIYVDNATYMDERYYNRLRFSLAHVLGHLILHQNFYKSLTISNVEDYYSFLKYIPREQYRFLETQANKFARYILVPEKDLLRSKQKELKKIKNTDLAKIINDPIINAYLANPIAKFFGVSEDVIRITLERLK